MGPRGAGHYVKMVHNGIEYGDMQLIAEVYDVLTRAAGMAAREIADVFATWNEGELRSYLVEITARVLERVDVETGKPLVDLILDEAQQKGTGKWMSQNAFDVGAPIPTVNAAVEARLLSALKSERVVASTVLPGPVAQRGPVAQDFSPASRPAQRDQLIDATRQALYAAKITSYAQGMALLRQASQEYKYDIDLAEVAKIWRAGCIIRAALLSDVRAAFSRNPALVNLMLDGSFSTALASGQQALRDVVRAAAAAGIPVPALGSSLAYYDSYRSARLPANLTQAQRDYFGAHTYRRVDRDGVFHTDWTHA
jgi:6-phosphogluconate dehydrogenase